MALLRGLWSRGARPAGQGLPRATGPARTVAAVHTADREGPIGRRLLPLPGLASLGRLVHLETLGPMLVRPGDLEDPTGQALRGVAELTLVLQGAVEHADGLGNRGRLQAPAARLVAGGGGLVTLVGPSRDLRRDGGDLHLVTMRWLQATPGSVPTTRLATEVGPRSQGRSTVTTWTGGDAALPTPDGTAVWTVQLAAGAGVDLAVGEGTQVLVAVLKGGALVGADLRAADPGQVVVMADDGPRLQLGTRLEQDGGALVLVIATDPADPDAHVIAEDGRLLAASPEDMQAALQHRREGGFGTLPSLDG